MRILDPVIHRSRTAANREAFESAPRRRQAGWIAERIGMEGVSPAPAAAVAAASHVRVPSVTSGIRVSRTSGVIGVEPVDLVRRHEMAVDKLAINRREGQGVKNG